MSINPNILVRLLYRNGLGVALSAGMAAWAWHITNHVLQQSSFLTSVIQTDIRNTTEVLNRLVLILVEHDNRAKEFLMGDRQHQEELIRMLTELRMMKDRHL